MKRRRFFQGSAAAAAAASGLAGCATAGARHAGARTPFAVAGSTIPVAGSDMAFPVRRIYCIGRNYRAHSIEMGSNPDREPPFFFQKNPNNLLVDRDFPYTVASNDVHHEIEMVVAL